jgi:hypothetical protein
MTRQVRQPNVRLALGENDPRVMVSATNRDAHSLHRLPEDVAEHVVPHVQDSIAARHPQQTVQVAETASLESVVSGRRRCALLIAMYSLVHTAHRVEERSQSTLIFYVVQPASPETGVNTQRGQTLSSRLTYPPERATDDH